MSKRVIIGFLLLATAGAWTSLQAASSILLEERSLYSTVLVKKTGNIVCLLFNVRRDQRNQSCINQKKPQEMVFAYTRMSMTALLFKPEPKSILVVGLGGGTLPTAFAELYPDAEIDAIEIDPVVVKVARQYFGLETSDTLRVHTQDARIWTRRANQHKRKFDIIILDAFNGEYIPEHLMTAEYFDELKNILAPDGVLISNTFAISELYDHESATYASVFGDFINFQVPQSANRVVIAPQSEVAAELIETRSEALENSLRPYGVPIKRYAKSINRLRKRSPDWDTDAKILTDQYSPANLLRERD